MAHVHFQTPDAVSMNEAIDQAFKFYGCETLGGASLDGWSKMSDFQRCRYRYYLKHELGAVAVDPTDQNLKIPYPPNLEIGGLYHAALALHYARRLPEGYPGWPPKLPPRRELLDKVEELRAEYNNVLEARRLYYGYSEHYGPELDLEPVAVEFAAGVDGVHTCRFDTLVWEEGALWNLEHKSARAETTDVMESWWLDGEIIGQYYAWRISELDKVFGRLTGSIINLAFKSHPAEYRRLKVIIPEQVVDQYVEGAPSLRAAGIRGDQYVEDRMAGNADRERCRRTGRWPRSLQGCMSRYDRCAFWAHCRDADNSLIQIGEKS